MTDQQFHGPANRAPLFVAIGLLVLTIGVGVVSSLGDSESATATTSSELTQPSLLPLTLATSTTEAVKVEPAEVPVTPLARTLSQGQVGDDVMMVQERLVELGFDPGPTDGVYGLLTKQAVWAFEKLVLGTPPSEATGKVTADMWQTLGGEVEISPRRSTNGQANHTEVYLTEQVLIVFHADKPALISHISSGQLDETGAPKKYCETATYDTDQQGRELEEPVTKAVCALAKTPGGIFTYQRQVEGKRTSPLGGMWNPVYFNYGIAVHGAENVPLQPASHGCVRLPMHISDYFQSTISIGDRILVWNGDKEPEQVTKRESLPSFDYADPSATTTTSTTTTTTTVAPPTTKAPAVTTTTKPAPPASTTTTTVPVATTTTTTTTVAL